VWARRVEAEPLGIKGQGDSRGVGAGEGMADGEGPENGES